MRLKPGTRRALPKGGYFSLIKEKSKIRLGLLAVILVVALLSAAGCGKKTVLNATPVGAAQIFIQAVTEVDSQKMEEINRSNPLCWPDFFCFEQAEERGWTGLDYANDFNYEQIDDTTVKVLCVPNDEDFKIKLTKLDDKYYFTAVK